MAATQSLHLTVSFLTSTLYATKLLAYTVMKEFLDWEQSVKMGKG